MHTIIKAIIASPISTLFDLFILYNIVEKLIINKYKKEQQEKDKNKFF